MPLRPLRTLMNDRLIALGSMFLVLLAFSIGFNAVTSVTEESLNNLRQGLGNMQQELAAVNNLYEEQGFQAHLEEMEQRALEESKRLIEEEYNTFKSTETQSKLAKIESIYKSYASVLEKVERNKNVGVNVDTTNAAITAWGVKFLNQEFDALSTEMVAVQTQLDQDHQQYLASLPTPTPKPLPTARPTTRPATNSTPAEGYSYQSVSTSRGSFNTHLIKLPLSSYRVKTLSANTENCTNNCPAKSLATYIQENNAYAGLNGTYFCPPDYASCAGKTYSYDFSVYNTNTSTWINQHSLAWNNIGLATFNGSSPLFYKESKSYAGASITAGIANFPSLVENGNVIVDPNQLASYQKDVRGVRGAIGSDGSNVYLAIMSNATVIDAAYVMQALGAKDSLNLDGGGSSALYINGSYKVGPGRSLPNAIVIVRN